MLVGKNTGSGRSFTGFLVFTRLIPEKGQDGVEAPSAGLLYNAFGAQDLFQTSLARTPLLPVNVEVYDGDLSGDNLMFRSETPPVSSLGETLLVTRTMEVAGRKWTILFR